MNTVDPAVVNMAPPPSVPEALLLKSTQLTSVIVDALAPIAPPAPPAPAVPLLKAPKTPVVADAVLVENVHAVAVSVDDVSTYIPPNADEAVITLFVLTWHCESETIAEL